MIMLLGASGYVGSHFANYFNSAGIGCITESVRYPIDTQSFTQKLKDLKITGLINCAGYTGSPNVDACEDSKEECLFANAMLPRQIAEVCAQRIIGVPNIHVSSGCIFTDPECEKGHSPSMEFTYRDAPNFTFDQNYRSWYSGTKALGEKLLAPYALASICRLRIPFNGKINKRNYLYKLINYDRLVNVTNSYTNLDEFVIACNNILKFTHGGFTTGARRFNLTQPGYMTTAEIVQLLMKHELVEDKLFFDSYEDFNKTVKTPRSNCVLRSCSDRTDTPFTLTPIRESIEKSIIEYKLSL